MRIQKSTLICVICFSALIACNSEVVSNPPESGSVVTPAPLQTQTDCIPPLVGFSYFPSGGERQGPKPESRLPSNDWEYISSIPNLSSIDQTIRTSVYIELVQHLDGKDQIWVRAPDSKINLARYHIESNEWRPIQNNGEIPLVVTPSLLVDKNNFVWMPRTENFGVGLGANTALLSIYDETNKQFSAILSAKDFVDEKQINSISKFGIDSIKMDSNGDFWFAVQLRIDEVKDEYQFIKFSPTTYEFTRHLENFEFGRYHFSFVIDEANIIYILDGANEKIIRYDPTQNTTSIIEIPSQIVSNTNTTHPSTELSNLFLDSYKRLWIDDRGWLDLSPNGDWHIVIRSPVFISYMHDGAGTWSWTHPTFSNESADGRLWYSLPDRGTGWVDPDNGEWCIFTSYPSNVVVDNKGDLWIVADGKLYRKSIQP
jgi:hypothetical protein